MRSNVMHCQVPEMLACAKGNPNFVNINLFHFRNRKSENIFVSGSYHDSVVSRLRGKMHVEYNACISFFVGTILYIIPSW